ncbi:MAG TPA: hypothetical protein VKU36_04885 [Candidatus Babeliales bacterium]|jgi:preprotein translocase subunit Sss1|nr:hypothetical protein [Candidatus Babeliales bacterium]
MLFKKILPFFCISALFAIHAMEEKIAQQQTCSEAWEKVKQTPEFATCAQFIKLQRKPSDKEFQKAFKLLHATESFKEYIDIGKPPFDECWPRLEEQTEKST